MLTMKIIIILMSDKEKKTKKFLYSCVQLRPKIKSYLYKLLKLNICKLQEKVPIIFNIRHEYRTIRMNKVPSFSIQLTLSYANFSTAVIWKLSFKSLFKFCTWITRYENYKVQTKKLQISAELSRKFYVWGFIAYTFKFFYNTFVK